MIVNRTTDASIEPVTLTSVKEHLRISIDDDDFILQDYIRAARLRTEGVMGRAFITQTWVYYLDRWPDEDYIKLPFPPLQSVTSVKYKDRDETEYTFDSADYVVDTVSQPGRVVLKYGEVWPTETLSPKTPIYITFEAGYGDDRPDIPMNIRLAVMALVGHWYENREAFKDAPFEMRQVPEFYTMLINDEACMRFGI